MPAEGEAAGLWVSAHAPRQLAREEEQGPRVGHVVWREREQRRPVGGGGWECLLRDAAGHVGITWLSLGPNKPDSTHGRLLLPKETHSQER